MAMSELHADAHSCWSVFLKEQRKKTNDKAMGVNFLLAHGLWL
jgi:hypothetical protein